MTPNTVKRGACSWLAALAACVSIAACGPPDQPRQEAKPGALGRAVVRATKPAPARSSTARQRLVPYIVIRFDRAPILYEDTLYSALTRALERYPAAAFDVVLAMPPIPRGADIEEATLRSERRIEDVVLLMTDMGLPAERVRIAATTDAAAAVDEIRIFVH